MVTPNFYIRRNTTTTTEKRTNLLYARVILLLTRLNCPIGIVLSFGVFVLFSLFHFIFKTKKITSFYSLQSFARINVMVVELDFCDNL